MIYIDDANIFAKVGRTTSYWFHLFSVPADDAQLVEFAESIGLRSEWIQKPGQPFAHFDVTEYHRMKAIRAGATKVTTREAIELLRLNRGAA